MSTRISLPPYHSDVTSSCHYPDKHVQPLFKTHYNEQTDSVEGFQSTIYIYNLPEQAQDECKYALRLTLAKLGQSHFMVSKQGWCSVGGWKLNAVRMSRDQQCVSGSSDPRGSLTLF